MSKWWVYIVPEDDLFFVGVTTDPPGRMKNHGHPVSCYLKGPMVQKEAVELEITYRSLSVNEQRELVFGISKRQ